MLPVKQGAWVRDESGFRVRGVWGEGFDVPTAEFGQNHPDTEEVERSFSGRAGA